MDPQLRSNFRQSIELSLCSPHLWARFMSNALTHPSISGMERMSGVSEVKIVVEHRIACSAYVLPVGLYQHPDDYLVGDVFDVHVVAFNPAQHRPIRLRVYVGMSRPSASHRSAWFAYIRNVKNGYRGGPWRVTRPQGRRKEQRNHNKYSLFQGSPH